MFFISGCDFESNYTSLYDVKLITTSQDTLYFKATSVNRTSFGEDMVIVSLNYKDKDEDHAFNAKTVLSYEQNKIGKVSLINGNIILNGK